MKIKKVLFILPILWQTFCGVNKTDLNVYRHDYFSELSRVNIEKTENIKYPPPRGDRNMKNYRLSLYFAFRDKEDSALKYFYEGIKDSIEILFLEIYIPLHIKSFSFEEKLFYIRDGRKKAKEKKLPGPIVDSYLIEGLLWKNAKNISKPSMIDSALLYSNDYFDSVVIKNNMLNIAPVYLGKYHQLEEKLLKRKPACGF